MSNRNSHAFRWAVLVCVVVLAWAGVATAQGGNAQLPPAGTASQFDITGFLQEATLDGAGAGAHQGGHLKVNGHVVIVPAETIVILPANALTWAELFSQAPAPYTGKATGMAMADIPVPLTTYEVHVVGNKAPGSTGAGDTYIAGLIDISQQALNSGQGYITNIDYTLGELQITNPVDSSTVRVRINDPNGRYGRAVTPDARFTVDADNPTIRSVTGFPMCLPRVAPAVPPATGGDDLCPEGNRPKCGTPGPGFCGTFDMPNPASVPSGSFPDPRVQAPFEIGDYITYAGTLVKDGIFVSPDGPTVGGWPGTTNTYISAHTIINNVAFYTWPNTNPAYVAIDVTLLGTGGATVLGATEAAARTRFEGFTTDPTRIIHLYGLDLPCAADLPPGALMGACDRDWGTSDVDPGPPTGAVRGRWRFRPPSKVLSMPPAGVFLPATREVRAVLAPSAVSPLPGWVGPSATPPTAANGLIYGQYHAPITEYIFPEQIPGAPIPPANFETVPFLAQGGYTSAGGTTVGQLNPWPGSAAPTSCGAAPVGIASAIPSTVFSGSNTIVNLDASASTGGAPLTFAWVQNAADLPQVGLINPSTAVASFTAPNVGAATALHFTVTVSNCNGSATFSVVVNVAVDTPLVNNVAPVSVQSGTVNVAVPISGVDPNGSALTFTVTQSGGTQPLLAPATCAGALQGALCVTPTTPTAATVTFNAPALPLGQVVPDVVTLNITATNTANAVSPTEFTTVTVTPLVDGITITSAEYRTSKQRLIINATDTVNSPNVVLTLQPYLTSTGTMYDPCTGVGCTFVNQGGGLYLLDLVGALPPACGNPNGTYATPCPATPMEVRSNLNGTSGTFGLTRIRQ